MRAVFRNIVFYNIKKAAKIQHVDDTVNDIREQFDCIDLTEILKNQNDVSKDENGQKRWSHIFKICKKYLTNIQNSVFEGEISTVQLEKLRRELKPHVNTNLDSVILFKSRSEKWLDKEFWGKEDDLTSFII